MNFKDASKVQATINAGDDVERVRSLNRVKVNDAANGFPPLGEGVARQQKMMINVDWGEMARLFAHARRQYKNAILGPQNYFRVTLPDAPTENKLTWELTITRLINRVLKRCRAYTHLKENQIAAVVAHGIGPQIWTDKDSWEPEFVAVEDFRVPTDTQTSFKNQAWFAIRKPYTEGELTQKVFGKNTAKGWRKKRVAEILEQYSDWNTSNNDCTWTTAPEKVAELVKQNLAYYSSDAVPTIPLWHFYYREEAKNGEEWRLRIVPDTQSGVGTGAAQPDEFLFDDGETSWGSSIDEIVSVQFGDLSNKAPFMFHSVRSLGFMLVEPCFWTNIFRCRLLQHAMENMNAWLRVSDPSGHAKAQKIELYDKCIVPEGVSIVPQSERHQINEGLVTSVMAQLRQLQSEAGQSYTQELDSGTSKEQTAFETKVKLSSVNAMMQGLLGQAFRYETYANMEICRRFCRENSKDRDVKKFQAACKAAGIPKEWLNSSKWDIEPEMPMGSGSPTMAMAEAQELMGLFPRLNPQAQQEVLHEAVEVITNNPKKADRLVPLNGRKQVTDGQMAAEFAFGTLMQGVPVNVKESLPVIEQAGVMIGLMAGVIARIEGTGNMATSGEVAGLMSVGEHINGLIQRLAQDETVRETANNMGKALGKLMNSVTGFAQRLQEQQGKQEGGLDPAAQAKIASAQVTAQIQGEIKAAQAKQKMEHKSEQFTADQQRKDVATQAEVQRQGFKTGAEIDQMAAKAAEDAGKE